VNGWLDSFLILLVLTNIYLLGSSRLGMCTRVVALQGVILAATTLLTHSDAITLRVGLLALASIVLKGVAFPWLLTRAMRDAEVRREIEPLIGYIPSILLGVVVLGLSLWISGRLPLHEHHVSTLVVPVALSTILTGLILIIGRKKALTQALGYLVMENGIFALGTALVQKQPMLVEMGVLLDVFFAVFVFGITIFHINREFNHIDTDRLASLKD